jgi:hypothetical protein
MASPHNLATVDLQPVEKKEPQKIVIEASQEDNSKTEQVALNKEKKEKIE